MSQSAKGGQPQAVFGTARRGRARPAGDELLTQASAAFTRAGFQDSTLILRWREIVGPETARIARPLRLREGPDGAVLTLKCDAGAIVFLQHQTRALLERLNTYSGASRIVRLQLVAGEPIPGAELPKHPGLTAGRRTEEGGAKTPLKDALSRLSAARAGARKKRAD